MKLSALYLGVALVSKACFPDAHMPNRHRAHKPHSVTVAVQHAHNHHHHAPHHANINHEHQESVDNPTKTLYSYMPEAM